jgi:hypothetical protein
MVELLKEGTQTALDVLDKRGLPTLIGLALLAFFLWFVVGDTGIRGLQNNVQTLVAAQQAHTQKVDEHLKEDDKLKAAMMDLLERGLQVQTQTCVLVAKTEAGKAGCQK